MKTERSKERGRWKQCKNKSPNAPTSTQTKTICLPPTPTIPQTPSKPCSSTPQFLRPLLHSLSLFNFCLINWYPFTFSLHFHPLFLSILSAHRFVISCRDQMAAVFQGLGAVTALSVPNSLESRKFLVPSRKSLSGFSSAGFLCDTKCGCLWRLEDYVYLLMCIFDFWLVWFDTERKASFLVVRSDGRLVPRSNVRGRRAEQLITNAVAVNHLLPFIIIWLNYIWFFLFWSLSFDSVCRCFLQTKPDSSAASTTSKPGYASFLWSIWNAWFIC